MKVNGNVIKSMDKVVFNIQMDHFFKGCGIMGKLKDKEL
jgi:hypothetical protein